MLITLTDNALVYFLSLSLKCNFLHKHNSWILSDVSKMWTVFQNMQKEQNKQRQTLMYSTSVKLQYKNNLEDEHKNAGAGAESSHQPRTNHPKCSHVTHVCVHLQNPPPALQAPVSNEFQCEARTRPPITSFTSTCVRPLLHRIKYHLWLPALVESSSSSLCVEASWSGSSVGEGSSGRFDHARHLEEQQQSAEHRRVRIGRVNNTNMMQLAAPCDVLPIPCWVKGQWGQCSSEMVWKCKQKHNLTMRYSKILHFTY